MNASPMPADEAGVPQLIECLLGDEWACDVTDPFPPAKSDEEIAFLVSEMGAELGVFDTQTRARREHRRKRRAPVRREHTTHHRVRVPPPYRARRGPPPVPVWAWPDTQSDPT